MSTATVLAELYEGIGIATNNVAEYRGLIAALEWALEHGHTRLHVKSDSLLVVQQMLGNYRVKHEGLLPLYRRARISSAKIGERDLRARPPRTEQGSRPAVESRDGPQLESVNGPVRQVARVRQVGGAYPRPTSPTSPYCACHVRPVLAQHELLNLPRRRARQFRHEREAVRHLEVREASIGSRSRSSSAVADAPGFSTTNAYGASPHFSCGRPTTPTSMTAGMSEQRRFDFD